MKKLLALLALSLLLLTGCAGGQQAAGFSQSDLVLTVAGETFDCDTPIEAVVAALGEDYGYAEGRSCAYDGLDKTYTYEDATFYTNPLEEGDIVTEIYTQSPQVTTSKGLVVGATRQQVEAAYGPPTQEDGYTLYYRVSEQAGEPVLCFDLEGDTVYAIYLTRGLI